MRNEKDVKSNSQKYNEATIGVQLVHEENNSAYNHHTIIDAFKNGRAYDLSDEPKKNKEPCIILGSGPSLDYSIKFLKDWKGGIICTTSHARTLMYYGIEPTYILVLDPFCCWDEIKGVDWSKTKTKMITHPGVSPDLIENWPNEFVMYICNMGRQDTFYATTQKRQYSFKDKNTRDCTFTYYIRTEVVLFACSPPMQLFMADLLGYGNVFLCGVDFGFHSGKERFTNFTPKNIDNGYYENKKFINIKKEEGNGEWEAHEHPYEKKENDIVAENGVITEDIHLYYKKNFLSAWRLSHQTIYTTDTGLITEIPFVSIESLIERQGDFPIQSAKGIDEITDEYLASVGCFVINTINSGMSFVECNDKNPLFEIGQYMRELNNTYVCSKCKKRFIYKPDGKEVDLTCPTCGTKTLVQANPVNEEENINRIKPLIEKINKIKRNKKRNENKKLKKGN